MLRLFFIPHAAVFNYFFWLRLGTTHRVQLCSATKQSWQCETLLGTGDAAIALGVKSH